MAEALRRQGGRGGDPPLLSADQDGGKKGSGKSGSKSSGSEGAKLASKIEQYDDRVAAHSLARRPGVARRLGALQAKQELAAAARAARREAKAAAGMVLGDELKARQRVLRRLGYMDEEGLVTTKGRVAADLQVGGSVCVGGCSVACC